MTDDKQKGYEKSCERVEVLVRVALALGKHPSFRFLPYGIAFIAAIDDIAAKISLNQDALDLCKSLCDCPPEKVPTYMMLQAVWRHLGLSAQETTLTELGLLGSVTQVS